MELREYVRALRRRWLWIVVPVVLAVGAAIGLTLAAPPAYRSSMVLFVTTGTGDPDAKASRLNSYIVLLTGPRVAESVISELNLPLSTKQVQDRISAQVQDGTDLLEVSVTDGGGPASAAVLGGSSCLARPTSADVAVVTIDRLRSAESSVADTTSRSVPSCTWAEIRSCTCSVLSGRSSWLITLSATRGPVSSAMYELSRLALASGSPVPVVTNSTIDDR